MTDKFEIADKLKALEAGECSADCLQRRVRCLEPEQMRDYIIRAHGMATGNYVQDDSEMRRRIGNLLDAAINSDDVMRGFLGRGGPMAGNDMLGGTGNLKTPNDGAMPAPRKTVK